MSEALVDRQIEFFASRGESMEWKTRGHDVPEALTAILRARGFEPEQAETVMVAATHAIACEAKVPSGIDLRRVESDAEFRRIAELETTVWSADWSWLADDLAARRAAKPDDFVVLIAEASGDIVSAAWLVINTETSFGGLWGGATLPGWRRRGIYRALVGARASIAAAAGVEYLQVDASDDSRPILQRLGFTAVTTTTPYVWSPSAP